MRTLCALVVLLLVFCFTCFVGTGTAHLQVGGGIGPTMCLVEDLDLDVLVEGLNESGLRQSIESYLDSGFVCMYLSTALEVEYANNDRLYSGCAAFRSGSDWDALFWDYDYDASSSQGTPAIPDDALTDWLELDPTGTEGLTPVLSDRLSWDYLLYVSDDLPTELYDELESKDLKRVWVEHQTGSQERMNSFWKYEGGGQSRTIRAWSVVTNGQFGLVNVD